MQKILSLTTEDSIPLTDDDIVNEIMLFFQAGHDTTACTMAWAFFTTCQRPEIVQKIREEANEKLSEHATLEEVNSLKYTEAVIKETLRVYPTLPLTGRNAANKVELVGQTIPKGGAIMVNIHALHRDPTVFENPEEFNPERFIDKTYPPHQYMPFGVGPKICVGQKLAMIEVKLAIARVYQRFDVVLKNDKVTPVYEATLGPKEDFIVNLIKK